MKISIITVVLNSKDLLPKTIQSIRNQTDNDIEYIVVDGGSTDGTLEVIKSNLDIISKWISEKDAGISDAFNKGIRLSTGEIVGILNAGDWFESDAVQTVVDDLTLSGKNIWAGGMNFYKKGKLAYVVRSKLEGMTKAMTLVHPSTFVRKAVYNRNGLFDLEKKSAMDYDLMLRFYVAGESFFISSKIIVNMIDGGISSKRRLKARKENLDSQKKYLGPSVSHYIGYFKSYFFLTFIDAIKLLFGESILNKIRPFYLKMKGIGQK